jgi:hypothetical protein
MVAVPIDMPVTIPVANPTSATEGLLLLQVPPPVASLKVMLPPRHTVALPVTGEGNGSTIMDNVVKQPVGSV